MSSFRAPVLPCAYDDSGNFAVGGIPDYKRDCMRDAKAFLVPDGGKCPPVCALCAVLRLSGAVACENGCQGVEGRGVMRHGADNNVLVVSRARFSCPQVNELPSRVPS